MWQTVGCVVLAAVVLVSTGARQDKESPFKFTRTGEPGGVIVQLFQWRFDDIAFECEDFLGRKGFAGVEVLYLQRHSAHRSRKLYVTGRTVAGVSDHRTRTVGRSTVERKVPATVVRNSFQVRNRRRLH